MTSTSQCIWQAVMGCVWCCATTGAADSPIALFVREHCVDCHAGVMPAGNRDFQELIDQQRLDQIGNEDVLTIAQEIVDQLNLSAMPPADSKQPSASSKLHVITSLTDNIRRHREQAKSQRSTVLRRLNAREYRNSIGEILGLRTIMFDPAAGFPADQKKENLDNQGDTLATSSHLLMGYLHAAERSVDKAMAQLVRYPSQTWFFKDGFRQQPEIDQVHGPYYQFEFIVLYDVIGADKPEGAYGPIRGFPGAPHDGFYELEFEADAINRDHPYDDAFLDRDRNEPFRLGIVAGTHTAGKLHLPQPIEPLLWESDIVDGKAIYKATVWLDQGFAPRFVFRNGLMDVRQLWATMKRKYPDRFPKSGGIVANRSDVIRQGHLPQIHIDNIAIRGPVFPEWPLASHHALLGSSEQNIESLSLSDLETRLQSIATQAFRRSLKESDWMPLFEKAKQQVEGGVRVLDALGNAVKSILCSPNFLFLDEQSTPLSDSSTLPTARLESHSLASRLSYFLWSMPPDAELRELANKGRIQQPSVLRQQVIRLLHDPRSNVMVEGFLDAWLNLAALGSMPPDRDKFRAYYQWDMGRSAKRETQLLFQHALDENIPLQTLLDCDYTFVDRSLTKLYEFKERVGFEFQRVAIQDPRRRGLLGHASSLIVSANGIDTSPVVRGVWLLENLLGTPPSPPPPDVEPLDPDVRGSTSIRDQLQKHRDNPACFECHRKIDPLGFALENFDAIGQWRNEYKGKVQIDASGKMADGTEYQDVTGLRKVLVKNVDLIARSLVTKMTSYAIGRRCGIYERGDIDLILGECKSNGYRMADLVHAIVLSDVFRSP